MFMRSLDPWPKLGCILKLPPLDFLKGKEPRNQLSYISQTLDSYYGEKSKRSFF